MKTAIYIPGLGQSVENQSMLLYAQRFMRELDVNHKNRKLTYELKSEKASYGNTYETEVITIFEKEDQKQTKNEVYRFYEFRYTDELVEQFEKQNIFFRSLLLFLSVTSKLPTLVARLFKKRNYGWVWESLYVFGIFFIVSLFIILLIPTALNIISEFWVQHKLKDAIEAVIGEKGIYFITHDLKLDGERLRLISKFFLSLSTILAIMIPGANLMVKSLATEFVCVHYYLQLGQQSQRVLGKLDNLVEFIAECEPPGTKIHIHAYSFGTVISIDYLLPFGNPASKAALEMVESLVTIASPYEFVNAYYKRYFFERQDDLSTSFKWLNIYSITDALSSNFRKDTKTGDPFYGIGQKNRMAINLNYEITKADRNSIMSFILLYGIRAHGMYWDKNPYGLSCLRIIVNTLEAEGLLTKENNSPATQIPDPEILKSLALTTT